MTSRGGLVIEHLLHKKCHFATVDRILSKYGVLIVQMWKLFVAIPIAGHRAALAVFDTQLTKLLKPFQRLTQIRNCPRAV